MMFKERFIGAVYPLHNILNSLASKSLPLWMKRSFHLGDMLHQLIGREMLSIQLVVAPVEGNTVVPDGGSHVDGFVQMAVPFAAV